MPRRSLASLLGAALVLTAGSACDAADADKPAAAPSKEASSGAGSGAAGAGEATAATPAQAEAGGEAKLDFAAAEACALLSVAQVAGVYGVAPEAVKAAPMLKAKPHRKSCRYSWQAGGVEAALSVEVEARREGPAGERFAVAIEAAKGSGLPVVGREGVTQTFTDFGGLGDEAYYSGNVNDSKALLARFGDRYVISLQHHHFDQDTGDQKPNLVALGRALAKRLAD